MRRRNPPSGGSIHLTDLDHLIYFNMDNQAITNLAGLECARNLNDLSLNGDPIQVTTPLSWLTISRKSAPLPTGENL